MRKTGLITGSTDGIGSDVLVRAALSDEFGQASGAYFDNDVGRFGAPHPDALDPDKCREVLGVIDTVLAEQVAPVPESA